MVNAVQDEAGSIPVIVAPFLNPEQRSTMEVPEGATIREIVTAALPSLTEETLSRVRVTLSNHREALAIERQFWARVRPKAGATIVIRIIPGKDGLRSILQIVVSIAALALGQFWAGTMLGLKAGTAAYGFASGLATVGASIHGCLQVDGLHEAGNG